MGDLTRVRSGESGFRSSGTLQNNFPHITSLWGSVSALEVGMREAHGGSKVDDLLMNRSLKYHLTRAILS